MAAPRLAIAVLALGAALAVGPGLPPPARAQQAPGAGAPAEQAAPGAEPAVPSGDIDALIRVLEDDRARAELLERLRAAREEARAPAEEEAGPGPAAALLSATSEALSAVTAGALRLGEALGDPKSMSRWLSEQVRRPERRELWAQVGYTLALVLVAAVAASLATSWLLARRRRRIEERSAETISRRARGLAARTLLDLLPVLAFGLAAHGALAFARPPEQVELVALAVVDAAILTQIVLALARGVLAPLAPGLRLIPLPDRDAAYAYVWTGRFARLVVYGYFLTQVTVLLGVGPAGRDAIRHLLGLVVAAMAFVLLFQAREPVAAAIRGREAPEPRGTVSFVRSRIADVWHLLAGAYLAAAYAIWALEIEGGFGLIVRGTLGTIAAVLVARLLVAAIRRGVAALFRVRRDLRLRYPDLEGRVNRYQPIVRGVLVGLIVAGAVVAALEAWGLDALALLGSEAGRAVVGRLAKILLILGIAVAVWETAALLVARYIATDEEGRPLLGSARVRTLLPLARSAILIVIATIATMTVLSEIGVDIAPLLAGAGVLGLAIGFGAQTLVKDVITGAFILFEDAISVGDVVEVGGHAGIVEAMNVRSIRHRDLSGVVHTVPFSSVAVVRNFTKLYSYYLMDIGVAYREDTDEVVAVITELLEEMRRDPDYKDSILEPLEVLGVDRFDDSAVVVRARIKTLPLHQWRIGREFNRRMKQRFDELGIEIPFPHRTLYFGVDKDGTAPEGRLRMRSDGPAPEPPAPGRSDGS